MAQINLNYGTTAGDGTGDILFDIFGDIDTNFTDLYTVSLNSSGTVDGTDQLFAGHVGVGGSASVGDSILAVSESLTDGVALVDAMSFTPTLVGSPAVVSTGMTAFNCVTTYSSTPVILPNSGTMSGILLECVQASTGGMSLLKGIGAKLKTNTGTGTVDKAIGIEVTKNYSTAPTLSYGISLGDLGFTGGTDAIGLLVANQAGSTNNYGIMLNGDGLGSDITFGAGQDVRQHFNGTNLEFEGSGIARTASTVAHDAYVTIAINGTPYKFMLGA